MTDLNSGTPNINEETQDEKDKVALKMKKRKRRRKILAWGTYSIVLIGGVGFGAVQGYIKYETKDLKEISYYELHSPSSSDMYASNGTKIWSSAFNKRIYVKYDDIPDMYIKLLLSTEDNEFYEHKGLSYTGLANAVWTTVQSKVFNKGEARGGSTIEQQLIKLTKFSTKAEDRTISRKVQEMYLAKQLYKNYSHEEILEFYVNKIDMGEGSHGVQTIANTYYGKPLKELSLSQLAIISGLGQAPGKYNLYDNPKGVEERRNTVLALAKERGIITEKEYKDAKNTPVTDGLKERYWDNQQSQEMTRNHNAYVNSALEQVKDLGYDLEQVPLQIYTNLNIDDDNYLRDLFNNKKQYFQDDKQQAGITVVDTKTGDVIAQSGGRFDRELDGYNRATQTNRSTGSGIKPILDYAPAFEYLNWSTDKIINDRPYQYKGTNVTAYDFGGEVRGDVNVTEAIRQSYNPAAIRTLEEVGEYRARASLARFGMKIDGDLLPSYALGTDASTEQMASAFAVLGNGGTYNEPRYVNKIKFPDESEKEITLGSNQAVRPSVAYMLTQMLMGVPSKDGTLNESDLTKENIYAGAKTGTVAYDPSAGMPSDASMDMWTNGYTKSFAFSMWTGYDKPLENGLYELQMYKQRQDLYKDIMRHFAKDRDTSNWEKPDTVKLIKGKGLSAFYAPIDEPRQDQGVTTLDELDMNANEDYSVLGEKVPKGGVTVEVPNNNETVPKNYDPNEWKDKLQKEKEEFYKKNQD